MPVAVNPTAQINAHSFLARGRGLFRKNAINIKKAPALAARERPGRSIPDDARCRRGLAAALAWELTSRTDVAGEDTPARLDMANGHGHSSDRGRRDLVHPEHP